LGFRIQNFAYLTDISRIDDAEAEKVMDVEVLIIDALRITHHFSHFTLQQAQEFAARVRAKRVYFTHLSHQIGLHDVVQASLPAGQILCYDGMEIEV
jgi:phosphoribosyl 1,2-cyclic phosphate phosphodiesterase